MLPWTYGKSISGQDSVNAIVSAELNWSVEKKSLYIQDDEFVELEDDCAIYRSDTKKHLGLCGRVYQPVQNIRAFEFMDSVSEHINYEYGGTFGGGKQVFLCASIPQANFMVGHHEHKAYINLLNPHTGKEAIKAYPVDTRGSVIYTLSDGIKVKHSAKTETRLSEGVEILRNTMNIFEKYGKTLIRLNEVATTPLQFKFIAEYASGVHHGFEIDEFPISKEEYEKFKVGRLTKRRESHIETVASLMRYFKDEDQTLYGSFMAVVNWANSQRYNGVEQKRAETKLSHLIFGKMRKIQTDVMKYIIKQA